MKIYEVLIHIASFYQGVEKVNTLMDSFRFSLFQLRKSIQLILSVVNSCGLGIRKQTKFGKKSHPIILFPTQPIKQITKFKMRLQLKIY